MGRIAAPLRMSREEWWRWSENQRGRSERVRGEVVAMAPERWAHARIKTNILVAFRNALAGHPSCVAMPDGMTVEIDEDTDYEPDVAIHCGGPIAEDSLAIPNPVAIVEVLSPSTQRVDTHVKLGDYFRLASVQHYLLVRADRQEITHYRRDAEGKPVSETRTSGEIQLKPPGIVLRFADVYAAA